MLNVKKFKFIFGSLQVFLPTLAIPLIYHRMQTATRKSQLFKSMAGRSIKVLIADDHSIFRHGLKAYLNNYPFVKFKGEAANGKELLQLIEVDPPDLVFMDLHMPGGHGAEASAEILNKYPGIKIVILSFYDDALTVERMMKMGASAYLTKNISLELLDAMFVKVLKGLTYISPDAADNVSKHKIIPNPSSATIEQRDWFDKEVTVREKQVLKLITQGLSLKEVGNELGLGVRTAESHKNKLMKKLGAKNIAELIAIAYEYKLL
jgi:DNA-binding NarL/FixJ family response regulator